MRLFSQSKITDVRDLGFNQRVDVDERVLHVQTEVSGGQELQVRTTVLEGGKVLHSASAGLSAAPKDIELASDEVKACHDKVVEQVRAGTVI